LQEKKERTVKLFRQGQGSGKTGIKICGLTCPGEAAACAAAGADAIGVVFYPESPRHVSLARAREITDAVDRRAAVIGVFVNEPFEVIMTTVTQCGLDGAQLHGRESPGLVESLCKENLFVIKAVFANVEPLLTSASIYDPTAYLVEAGGGKLPGGNADRWGWQSAAGIDTRHPVILAGGLSPENVQEAMHATTPSAVDVSSGVESEPGRKNMDRVIQFIAAVRDFDARRHNRRLK